MKRILFFCLLGFCGNALAQNISNYGITSLSSTLSGNSWHSINSYCKGGASTMLFSGLEYPLIKSDKTNFYLSIYPNPASSEVSINANFELEEILVYTIDGRLVQYLKAADKINVSNLPSGLYQVEGINRKQAIQIVSKLNVVR